MDESFPIETHKNTAVDELVEDKNISLTEVDDERRCYHHDPEDSSLTFEQQKIDLPVVLLNTDH
jgi:hypothetical protein